MRRPGTDRGRKRNGAFGSVPVPEPAGSSWSSAQRAAVCEGMSSRSSGGQAAAIGSSSPSGVRMMQARPVAALISVAAASTTACASGKAERMRENP